jgi:thiamine-phosphate pyrophosphorylase
MSEIGGLYVIIDPAACRGRDPVAVARQALEGGASLLQWRDKVREKGLQLPEARSVFDLCVRAGRMLFVNDHADLALALLIGYGRVPGAGSSGARHAPLLGVHAGQKDLPVAALRRILPRSVAIGASTNDVAEARRAVADGAAYVAVGDIFGTRSKVGTRAASPQRLAEVRAAVDVPVFGIGGIDASNARRVMEAGADGVAVISAVCGAKDPRAAAAELAQIVARYRRRQ